ncbi:FecR domain-containing protein [Halieaceae bacterium]|nr:FecR domain-containing protein [Halieaceae bacterium]
MKILSEYEKASRYIVSGGGNNEMVDKDLLKAVRHTSDAYDALSAMYKVAPDQIPDDLSQKIEDYQPQAWFRRNWYQAAVAAAVVLMVITPLLLGYGQDNVFQARLSPTAVTMADGSIVTLNANSKIVTEYSGKERRIKLVYGEVYFDVQKDASRPFVVSTQQQEFTAIGTEFSVKKRDRDLRLLVTEGRVKYRNTKPLLTAQGTTIQPEYVSRVVVASQGALVSGQQIVVKDIDSSEMSQNLSWRKGYLSFEDASLEAITEEMNHYISGKIILMDADLAAIRSGGAYKIGNEKQFIAAMQQTLPIRVVEVTPYLTLLYSTD